MTKVASISMCSQSPVTGAAPASQAAALAAARAARTRGRCAASMRSSTSRHIVVVEAFAPEDMLTVAAQLSDRVDAVRPVSDRDRQIGEHLPGRIHPRATVGIRQRGGDLRR